MNNGIKINDELIAKYLSGEASPEEAMALDDWLQQPSNRLHFIEMKKMWDSSFPSKTHRGVDLEKAWGKVNVLRNKKAEGLSKGSVSFTKTFFRIAASFLLVLLVGGIFYWLNQKEKSVDLTSTSGDSLKHISFEDRSTVVLNRNSDIVYPERFGNEMREVQFTKGEAFFDIAPDATKPFIIQTEIATIKVLGTAFNVLLKKDTLEVSVDRGRVLVYTSTDSVYLDNGDAAVIQKNETSFTTRNSNSNSWAYATHKFVFSNTSVREVFNYVEKAQDCSILLENPDIGNCKLTATFESVSTDYMLTLISEALNLSVTKNDDRTFTVEGEGCH